MFRGAKRIAGKAEAEVYRAVDLPFMEPELRENRGELEAAAAGTLPTLIELRDLRGDLHCHTVGTARTACEKWQWRPKREATPMSR